MGPRGADEGRREEGKGELDRGLQMLAIARIKDVSTFSSDRHHFIRSPSANKCFPSGRSGALKIRRVQPVCHAKSRYLLVARLESR